MHRKFVSPALGAERHVVNESLLAFTVWITPPRGATSHMRATFVRQLEDYLIGQDIQSRGGFQQLLVWSDERSLTAGDQVNLLLWLINQAGAAAAEIGPLQSHSGAPSERGSQPVLQARFGDLALIPISWLYACGRLDADLVIRTLGGFRATVTLH